MDGLGGRTAEALTPFGSKGEGSLVGGCLVGGAGLQRGDDAGGLWRAQRRQVRRERAQAQQYLRDMRPKP